MTRTVPKWTTSSLHIASSYLHNIKKTSLKSKHATKINVKTREHRHLQCKHKSGRVREKKIIKNRCKNPQFTTLTNCSFTFVDDKAHEQHDDESRRHTTHEKWASPGKDLLHLCTSDQNASVPCRISRQLRDKILARPTLITCRSSPKCINKNKRRRRWD